MSQTSSRQQNDFDRKSSTYGIYLPTSTAKGVEKYPRSSSPRRLASSPDESPRATKRNLSIIDSKRSPEKRKSLSLKSTALSRRESMANRRESIANRRESTVNRRESTVNRRESMSARKMTLTSFVDDKRVPIRRRESVQLQMMRLARSKTHELIKEQHELRAKEERIALTKKPEDRTAEDLEALDAYLVKIAFFQNLNEDTRYGILKAVEYECVDPCTILCREGDIGDSFYIVIDGRCGVRVWDDQRDVDVTVGFIKAGGTFGELALQQEGSKRQATVICMNTVSLLKLHQEDYNRILRESDERETRKKVKFLQQVQLAMFENFSNEVLEDLASVMTVKTFEKDKVIIKQGAIVDEMYFITRGEVRLIKETMLEPDLLDKVERMAIEKPEAFSETLRSASNYGTPVLNLKTQRQNSVRPQTTIGDTEASYRRTGFSSHARNSPSMNMNMAEAKSQALENRPSTTGSRTRSKHGALKMNDQKTRKIRPTSAANSKAWRLGMNGKPQSPTKSTAGSSNESNASQRQSMRTFLEVGVLGAHDCFGDLTSATLNQSINQSISSRQPVSANTQQQQHRPTSIGFSVVSTCHLECYMLNKWDVQRKLAMHEDAFNKFQQKLYERNKCYVSSTEVTAELQRTLNWVNYRDDLRRGIKRLHEVEIKRRANSARL